MKSAISLIALLAAIPAMAEETRQLDVHEHGVGALNIAFDGETVAMEFHAPGADIVGFEYAAESEADLSAIEAALTKLNAPLELFVMPEAAACTVSSAFAELGGESNHEKDHDEHKDEEHSDHDHDEHDDHDKHEGDDHEDHADEAGHTEFHAEYALSCDNPDALIEITFAYFDAFPNAKAVEVQIISSSGAQAFEVERDAPVLNLER